MLYMQLYRIAGEQRETRDDGLAAQIEFFHLSKVPKFLGCKFQEVLPHCAGGLTCAPCIWCSALCWHSPAGPLGSGVRKLLNSCE